MASTFTDDAAAVLRDAHDFLVARPVEHNLMLTLLHQRARSDEAGRYWTVREGGETVGVVFQSPIGFWAAITPMTPDQARVAASAVAASGVTLPGVQGEASAASAFAGHWGELRHTGARPVHGMRLHRLGTLLLPTGVDGTLRTAAPADVPLVFEWGVGFARFVGEASPSEEAVSERVARGEIALWDVGGEPTCMAGHTEPVAAVSRIGPVYTPPALRRRGYAAACVGALSGEILGAGHSCVLYTDLANPTSSAVYRSLGYEAISEYVRYEFDGACQT